MVQKFFKSIVRESFFYMLFAGLLMGLLFMPASNFFLGLPSKRVYSFDYGLICVASGLFVGFVSFIVIRVVILNRLNDFSNNISVITQNILNYKKGNIKSIDECKNCYIRLNSRDVLGELTGKYNALIRVIRSLFWQYERMDDFFSTLNSSLELKELDKNVAEFVKETINSAFAVEVYHIDKLGNLNIGYAKGVHSQLTQSKNRSLIDIIRDKNIVDLRDSSVEIVEFGTSSIKPTEITYFPFKNGETDGGALVLYLNSYMSLEEKTLIDRLLNEYALALKSSLAYQRMQNMAAFDELTNIYNRRFGTKRLVEEYQRAKRLKGCLCVLMFDIDHFKAVNDTYGHQAGDFILSSFANMLNEQFRLEDVVMRYGGEEFLCAMSNASAEVALKKAEEIRRKIEESTFKWQDADIKITISCGIATLNTTTVDKPIEEIIKDADEKLYIAKNSGRNRCIHSKINCLT
jgi:two-component system cell cycle response regulator